MAICKIRFGSWPTRSRKTIRCDFDLFSNIAKLLPIDLPNKFCTKDMQTQALLFVPRAIVDFESEKQFDHLTKRQSAGHWTTIEIFCKILSTTIGSTAQHQRPKQTPNCQSNKLPIEEFRQFRWWLCSVQISLALSPSFSFFLFAKLTHHSIGLKLMWNWKAIQSLKWQN